jgi:hypothetical protein
MKIASNWSEKDATLTVIGQTFSKTLLPYFLAKSESIVSETALSGNVRVARRQRFVGKTAAVAQPSTNVFASPTGARIDSPSGGAKGAEDLPEESGEPDAKKVCLAATVGTLPTENELVEAVNVDFAGIEADFAPTRTF